MSTFQRWRSMIRRSNNLDIGERGAAFTQVTGAVKPHATIPSVVTLEIVRDWRSSRCDDSNDSFNMSRDRWTPEQIFVYRQPVDMRKQIAGPANIVSSQLHHDPSGRALYPFINRAWNKIKLLIWHLNGYYLLYRRKRSIQQSKRSIQSRDRVYGVFRL